MEKIYLVDFENVHNKGLENIDTLTETDHVHIFYTENASNISLDILTKGKGTDIVVHKVPARKQSLDMHLVSYLGYLLGVNENKTYSYVIVSNDKDYDNIIAFWHERGIKSISREQKVSGGNVVNQKRVTMPVAAPAPQTTNNKINTGMANKLSGSDRSKLNVYMQRGLIDLGYSGKTANTICKCVIAYCNDERMLNEIHNDLREEFSDYSEVYEDVKTLLKGFSPSKSRVTTKRELQVRSFFGQHFRKKIYVDKKEDIIKIILDATTRQQVNNELMKLYRNGDQVKEIRETLQPLIKDLPGK
ncbi:MAG: hypothetical protein HDR02_12095 [Lachnospiraceae bacterium]|nr:hypothetical protein [Lachnospiraceae bacterium]